LGFLKQIFNNINLNFAVAEAVMLKKVSLGKNFLTFEILLNKLVEKS
jgi:hypothetical protein